ncbi:uncharacterized protein EMH_0057780 [Eimeria mitis]|uniref:Uncharacterized protein n=1 Tax=Eimeria mitis TaxID=44415 RepID=U6KGX6_9EIME|nr:uncharacterized protein EMH_0057780 [Eimeria mitis]CDJ36031.1 hypothetical protein EMH_0057780 [Eimeria mitis]
MHAFRDALRCTFFPRYASEQAMEKLGKVEQGKLSIDCYIEKYRSFVDRNPMVDLELLDNWFRAGLSSGERQSVAGWATGREMRGEKVEFGGMIEYLRRRDRKNATSIALAEKEKGPGDDLDLERLDIGAEDSRPPKSGLGAVTDRRQ